MRNTISGVVTMAALLLASGSAHAEPLRGDGERGGRIFRMECGTCHGVDGSGSSFWQRATAGKKMGLAPDLRDSALLAQRSDADLAEAIGRGMGRNGWIPGHNFAGALSTLEIQDLIQWLRDGSLTVSQFFPEATRFTARDFAIDQWGLERLTRDVGLQLSQEEVEVVVLTVYRGQRSETAGVELVPWEPVRLDMLEARDRIGYLSFQEIEVPGGERARIGLGIGTDGKLQRVIVNHSDPAKKKEWEDALSRFVGQGKKGASKFTAPRGLKNGDAWARALTRAAAISAEGITMYEKSERERTAFDR